MDSENLLNVVFSGFFATLRMTIKVVAPFVLLFQGVKIPLGYAVSPFLKGEQNEKFNSSNLSMTYNPYDFYFKKAKKE